MATVLNGGVHGISNFALLQTYKSRFEELTETERKKDELIMELLRQNEKLSGLLERYEDDLEREKSYARTSQKEIRDLKTQFGDAEDKLNSYPYIQVLIDGDGMLFHLDLLKKKKEGGSEAAELLLSEIRELVRPNREDLCIKGDFEIRALVFANLDGLSKALVKSNILKQGDLQQFFMGFTQRLEHLNFIDVGYGKEMADSKIRGEFLFHLKDPRCRLILFGGGHDNGYAPFLKTCTATNPNYPIWLLEGPPMAREIASMNLPSQKLHDLFSKNSQSEITNGSPISAPAILTPTTSSLNGYVNGSNGGSVTYDTPQKFSYASAAVSAPPGLIRPTSIHYSSSPTLETSKTITISGSGTSTSSNNPPRGIQHTMVPSADAERVNYIKNLNPRACNNFYLRGACYQQPCSYSHKYKLSNEDVKTLKYIIERSKPCQQLKKKGFCEDEKCYYGHQCAFRTNAEAATDGRCSNFYCRFCQDDE
ncbi:hypothetical protein TWF225_003144 [Orbilia oligospora]|uniref:Uncharacterized protein n=1 Tax=Orbilia oligospora TaxID=2813651 RepID=A0A7C8PRB3_ORBOL|nr:hypothetical protein TWF225_003144 [Orbilia oligospora]KAF3175989.1 hypothetical protein TWF751_003740 [Orbilia oligospora]KAF3230705.1 hypothetical protein TWF128_005298 [Orbilia oligospora]KAF3263313.1 hypothetical protein TWF217_003731 [Orbilia oligospora]KAF3279712.1 hypothetical protein TWF132_012028 [Orbilia oligospora]